MDDSPVHTYGYNAMNRLEKARQYGTDGGVRSETAYAYNGLGQRVSRVADGVREDYLLDLTRPYHNLLTVKKNDDAPAQAFYWDHNVAAMEEAGSFHYYLQDEMGSPIRVSRYENGYGSGAYLSYGYDEFGNDLADSMGRELEEAGIPNPYCAQGEEQPFGYTGYRYDKTGGTYFAQAREYQPGAGRFCAQDVILYIRYTNTLSINMYTYCWNVPTIYADPEGTDIFYFYDPNAFAEELVSKDVENDKRHLEAMYDIEVQLRPISTKQEFIDGWNAMPNDESIEAVILYTHSNSSLFQINTAASYEQNDNGEKEWRGRPTSCFWKDDVQNLEPKNIELFAAIGCNVGKTDDNENMACEFISKNNNLGIESVIAADGKVAHKRDKNNHSMYVHQTADVEKQIVKKGSTETITIKTEVECDGFKLYQYNEEGLLDIKPIGYEFENVGELIEAARQMKKAGQCDEIE